MSGFSGLGTEAMRGKRSTTPRERHKSRRETVVEHWERLGRPTLGARELQAILDEFQQQFGNSAVQSPAAVARLLADEGAELRHPDVIEFDARWREETIGREAELLPELSAGGEPLTLAKTEVLIERLEQLRTQIGATEAPRLRAIALEAKKDAELRAKRKTLVELQRLEQLEIAEWIGVWLRTPNLFKDWMDLRRRSSDFQQKFG
jgi:hypothetical protein